MYMPLTVVSQRSGLTPAVVCVTAAETRKVEIQLPKFSTGGAGIRFLA
jgi:hypothetical protein